MDYNFLITHLNNPAVLIPKIRKEWKSYFEWKAYREYDVIHHKVNSPIHRKDKLISKQDPTGAKDELGNPIMFQALEPVNRIAIPYQKLIVNRASVFLCGGRIVLVAESESASQEEFNKVVVSVWKKNKLDYKTVNIAELMMSETECCEIWYTKINRKGDTELRVQIYSPSMGYDLMPVFDALGDLIAFGLQWDDPNTKTRHFNLYTDEQIIFHEDTGSGMKAVSTLPNRYGKIPVIYYGQQRSEWADVQQAIDRRETLESNFADTVDYNGSPILFSNSPAISISSKGESGKFVTANDEGGETVDLKYVTWEQAPDAIELHANNLDNIIYSMTQTPNISFDQMKGLGDISGVALDRIMIDAHLKAIKRQVGDFGESIQRRVNFLKAAVVAVGLSGTDESDMDITPQFSLFRINDDAERIAVAQSANGGKPVMSQRESIEYIGLSSDVDKTMEEIKAEAEVTRKQQEPVEPPAPPVEEQ